MKHYPFVRIQGEAKTIFNMLLQMLEKHASLAEITLLDQWYWARANNSPGKEDTLDVGVVCYARNRWKIIDNESMGGTVVCQLNL